MRFFNPLRLSLAALACASLLSAQAPTTDTLKQLLNARLMKLLPGGFTERNVLFQEVRAGAPNGGDYAFQVTALIRDYGPGYPANRFYGTTCVRHMNKRVFRVSQDEFGQMQVEGPMTVTSEESECKPNPSAGVSSIPLSALAGTAAPAGEPAHVAMAHGSQTGLASGEWACYGTGGRLLIGLGFRAQANGTYTDLDHRSTGTYSIQGGAITFRGGSLNGQSGRNFRGNHFELGSTVSCEPFH